MARLITMNTREEKKLTIERHTMDHRPIRLEGTPTFTVQSGDCKVTTIDAAHAMLVAGEHPGESRILVEAMMDLDDDTGAHPVTELLIVQVQGERAAELEITVGEAEVHETPAHGRSMSTAIGEPGEEHGASRRAAGQADASTAPPLTGATVTRDPQTGLLDAGTMVGAEDEGKHNPAADAPNPVTGAPRRRG